MVALSLNLGQLWLVWYQPKPHQNNLVFTETVLYLPNRTNRINRMHKTNLSARTVAVVSKN